MRRVKMKQKLASLIIIIIMVISGFFGLITFYELNVKGTNVGGLIDTDTVWTVLGSPYIVVSDIEVANGINLTIEPGVQVKFDGKHWFNVYGYLNAVGTENNRIEITSNNIAPKPGDWLQINIRWGGRTEIQYCNINYGHSGLLLQGSSFNNITFNNISNNMNGILLYASTNNTILNNTFQNAGIFLNGAELSHFNSHMIINNTVNGKPLYYHKDLNDIDINNTPVGQLILVNCTQIDIEDLIINNTSMGIEVAFCENVSIENCTIVNTMNGISIFYSSGSVVLGNNVTDNWAGIDIRNSNNNIIEYNNFTWNWVCGVYVWRSEKNTIINNNIKDNLDRGVWLDQSMGNYIYHNYIINNIIQALDNENNNHWDNGYPSGGNYWSDYVGVDNFKGPLQNIVGKDDIGDTNYSIDSDSRDNYPLMVIQSDSFVYLEYGWNLISLPIIQSNTSLFSVLAALEGHYDAVQLYNTTDVEDHWKHYNILKSLNMNDQLEVDHKLGFWIHITNPNSVIFRYDGLFPIINQTINLNIGWNLVGYPSLIRYNRTFGLNNLTFDTHVDCIQWYDAATKTWHFMGPDDSFVPGRGYWVHSMVDVEWEVPL
jgi:parallel beta-helix repeat protein